MSQPMDALHATNKYHQDRPRKRARRDRRNQFIDIEAEVDDDEEDGDDEDEAEVAGFIAGDEPEELGDLPQGADTDDRRHRELDRQREAREHMDAEAQAAALQERYRSYTTKAQGTDTALVPKRLLLPSVDDPSIWGVRCKPGKEREVVFSILKRIEERLGTRNALPIISALERGGTMAGYVYIETRRQADIIPALDGIMNVYPRTKIVLVPIKEMPDLLRVKKTEILQEGAYVRIKRGKYTGDLAQIDIVDANGVDYTLKIVPRLDYGMNEDAAAPFANGDGKRKRPQTTNTATRPAPRLFNENEAKKRHARHLQAIGPLSKKSFVYLGDTYENGFLVKEFKINHLQTTDVNPTLEEVTRFTTGGEDGNENLDLTALAASLKSNAQSDAFLPGDDVEVFSGEQKGVTGRTTAVHGDIVSLLITEGDLKGQALEIPVSLLRKRFREGDHVKVIGGSRYRDEVGLVVRIHNDQVTIVSDLSMQEISVFSKDLRVAADSGVAGGVGRYDIHDLVQLE